MKSAKKRQHRDSVPETKPIKKKMKLGKPEPAFPLQEITVRIVCQVEQVTNVKMQVQKGIDIKEFAKRLELQLRRSDTDMIDWSECCWETLGETQHDETVISIDDENGHNIYGDV